MFDLYKFYLDKPGREKKDYRNLLNIANPSCTIKNEPNKEVENLTCLSGSTLSHDNFNELNLSDYDEIITDSYGNYIGFCLSSMYLKNNLGVQKFYSKAGQTLIKQVNVNGEEEIQIYNSNYNPVRVRGTDVATATIRKMCYVLPGRVVSFDKFVSNDDVTLYFGDNNWDRNADELQKESKEPYKEYEGNNESAVLSTHKNNLVLYDYKKEIGYKLNTVYLENISGKPISGSNYYLNAVLSKFVPSSGTIPFKIYYGGKTYGQGEDLCKYETKGELLDPELKLEFRIIDTNNPFNRKTMSNWSYGTDNSKDNNTVKNYIIKATNSYGLKKGENTKQSPKYKITLTPTEIKNIRVYNKNIPYDNNKENCSLDSNNNQVCKNTFIQNLRQGKIIIYDESGNGVKTLTNAQLLYIDENI